MTDQIDLRTLQLLCSRICHDLVGPIGAVNTAIELMGDDDDGALDAEAMAVLARSAQEANRKLTFFRAVFGLSGGQETDMQSDQLQSLSEGLLMSSKVSLRWAPDFPTSLPGSAGKILMLLVFLSAEALSRGGRIDIRAQEFSDGLAVACVAEGDGADLKPEIQSVLADDWSSDQLSARAVPARILAILARENTARIEFSNAEAGQVTLAVLFSNASTGQASLD